MFYSFYTGREEASSLSCEVHHLLDQIESFFEGTEEDHEIEGPYLKDIEDFLKRSHSLYQKEEYEGAQIAYRCLFYYLLTPLSDFDLPLLFYLEIEEKDKIDLKKAQKEFFHSLYVTKAKENRGERFIEAFGFLRLHDYLSKTFSFRELEQVQGEPLPDFRVFLEDIMEELKRGLYPEFLPHLLLEAAHLLQGKEGIIALAKEMGEDSPEAYAEWIEILKREEDHRAIIEVAEKGLEIFVNNKPFRIFLNEELAEVAQSMGDTQRELSALLESFSSSLSIDHMTSILLQGRIYGDEQSEKIKTLLKENRKDRRGFYKNPDTIRALRLYLLVWDGEFQEILSMYRQEEPSIYCSQNDRFLVLTLFLRLLKKDEVETPHLDVIVKSVEESSKISFLDKEREAQFWEYAKKAFEKEEDKESFFLLCRDAIHEYVTGILNSKQSDRYDEAVKQMATFIESTRETEWEEKAYDFCERIRYSYLKLRKFQRLVEEKGLFS